MALLASMSATASIGDDAECAALATYAGLQDEKKAFITKMVKANGGLDANFYYGFAIGYLYKQIESMSPKLTDKEVVTLSTESYALKCLPRKI